jgi:hypothetical protein
MSKDAARATEFGGANPDVPIRYENVKFDVPETSYVHFRVQWVKGRRASIGTANRFERHHGMVVIEIYAAEDRGMKEIYDLSDQLEEMFSEKTYSLPEGYITCYVTTVSVYGQINTDGYYMAMVTVPFHYDITRS